jgi:multiple sugar transport system permease protein
MPGWAYRRREKALPYAYLSPAIILIGVLLLYPLVSGIFLSFVNRDAYTPAPVFVGLKNYLLLARDKTFLLSLWHTIWWALSVLVGQYLLGLLLAVLLNKPIPGRAVFRAIILTPWVIPPALAAITWKWIYEEQYGILNSILISLGLIRENVAWLATDATAMWAIIAAGIWQGIPFVAIVLLAGLQAIPGEEYEAATIDGANSWQSFRYLTIPHLRNISFIVIILSTIWNINQFELTYILTRGGPGNATQVLSTYTYQLFFSAFQFSMAAAVATVMLIIMMVLTGFYIRRIIYPR